MTPMNAYKNDSFGERLAAAANVRKATLEKFRARPGPDDPAVLERKAAREAEAARQAAEATVRVAEQERQAAEQAARQAEAAERAAALDADKKARALALAAEQKAARDARYA